MTEKDVKKYNEILDSWMSLSGDSKDECVYRYPVEIRIQADIARQLTRIADMTEDRMISEGIYQQPDTAKSPPADDALVEAVKFYANADNYVDGTPGNLVGSADGDRWECDLGKIAKDALAAHEKAGKK